MWVTGVAEVVSQAAHVDILCVRMMAASHFKIDPRLSTSIGPRISGGDSDVWMQSRQVIS